MQESMVYSKHQASRQAQMDWMWAEDFADISQECKKKNLMQWFYGKLLMLASGRLLSWKTVAWGPLSVNVVIHFWKMSNIDEYSCSRVVTNYLMYCWLTTEILFYSITIWDSKINNCYFWCMLMSFSVPQSYAVVWDGPFWKWKINTKCMLFIHKMYCYITLITMLASIVVCLVVVSN